MIKFYDTCSLLELQEKAFEETFVCSDITLHEIENIKTSRNKDEDIKYKARKLAHLFDDHFDGYYVVVWNPTMSQYSTGHESNDEKICQCAAFYRDNQIDSEEEIVFVSNDICCKNIAMSTYDLKVTSEYYEDEIQYVGYKEVQMSGEEMSYFYNNLKDNIYELLVNQYLIILDNDMSCVDIYKWTGIEHKKVCNKTIKSKMFGDSAKTRIKPKDAQQSCVIDSIMSNTMTIISGKAGSGKSLLSLASIMSLIEDGSYERVVIMFNPTKAKGASDMGYYSGDSIEKAMQNSIGSILTTKFGDRFAVDLLLQQDKLRLVSMADIRGMEVKDDEILFMTEAQNMTVELLKLCLSRASSGCKIILDGDFTSQVDSRAFEGQANGMKRAINVFKDRPEVGCIQLKNVWRSKIAELCELL